MKSLPFAGWSRQLGIGGVGVFFIISSVLAYGVRPTATSAVVVEGRETRYALSPGATSFIVCLTGPSPSRDFTFLNENMGAEGRLSIAVSKQRLAPDSPEWSTVDGVVRFRHKRRITLSLVGVEANYVKLTFQVELAAEDKTAPRPGTVAAQASFAAPVL